VGCSSFVPTLFDGAPVSRLGAERRGNAVFDKGERSRAEAVTGLLTPRSGPMNQCP
jgi:hypothetical protein